MFTSYSTNEILSNFDKSTLHAESVHINRAMGTLVAAIVLYLVGLAALSYSYPILAAVFFLSGLHFNQHSHRHLIMGEIATQNRAMAHLIASIDATSQVNRSDGE